MKFITTIVSTFLLMASLSGCSEQTETVANVTKTELQAGRELISDNCSGCHMQAEDGSFSRISQIRKTPEGWGHEYRPDDDLPRP